MQADKDIHELELHDFATLRDGPAGDTLYVLKVETGWIYAAASGMFFVFVPGGRMIDRLAPPRGR